MTIGPDGYGAANLYPYGAPQPGNQPPGSWDPTQMAPQPPVGYPGHSGHPGYSDQGGVPPAMTAYGPPATPPRNRKPLFIGLGVGAVVLLVAGIVAAVTLSGGGKHATAGEALTAYLEALARGDAETALSYGKDQPGSTDLLTDEILAKQIEHMPITDIRILGGGDDSDNLIGLARVHVSVKFGEKVSDETVSMTKTDDGWKLDNAAIKLESTGSKSEGAEQTLTLFGQSLGNAPAYVFPGWLDLASSNVNIEVTSDPVLLNALSYSSLYSLNIKYQLSATGTQNIKSAIRTALTACTTSHKLSPPNCPQRLSRSEAAEDTVDWGVPDPAGLDVSDFSEYRMYVRFNGDIEWPLTAKKRDGDPVSGTVTTYVSGEVDLATDPPVASLS